MSWLPCSSSKAKSSDLDDTDFCTLTGIVLDALGFNPLRYPGSILGRPQDLILPKEHSEYSAVWDWYPWRSLRTLVNMTLPSIPKNPPTLVPPLLQRIFWQPSTILQHPDHNGNHTSFPDEQWLYVNGILSNDAVSQLHAGYLAFLFHRPITLIQNSTDSALIDLLECAYGKQWQRTTEPVIKAFPVLYDALKNPLKRRVVVIAHSQGSIIMSNVLHLLASKRARENQPASTSKTGPVFDYPGQEPLDLCEFDPLTDTELAKLEVYSFATCSNHFRYIDQPSESSPPIPWLEHFGNEHDVVARLGMLAPRPDKWGICIEGPIYEHKAARGHLLTEHHLFAIQAHQRDGRRWGAVGGSAPFTLTNKERLPETAYSQTPRLFGYLNGGA